MNRIPQNPALARPPRLHFFKRVRVLVRAVLQFRGWYQRLLAEEVARGMKWHGSRILVPVEKKKGGGHIAIFSPVAKHDDWGMIQRTHRIFDHHTYAVYTSTENKMFIRAASGKRCFLDIGAAEGYYSAVFSAIAGENAEILSVDPMDPGWVGDGHLKSVRDQNSYFHRNRRWEIAKAYLTDHGNAIDSRAQVTSDCSVMTLAQLLGEYHFSPDFIKMDIESWEWEVLLSSLDLLNKLKPTILLEIHSSQLRDRGFSAVDLVERLRVGAGYRVTLQESRDFATAGNSHLVLDPIKK